ncbi:alanine racemase [Rhodovulum sp. DZ06]|uniref:alanine racemase n=1 Tax=Rhodovulum sp. DZ06 TaxID=3425126 RepID=UPI003D340C57
MSRPILTIDLGALAANWRALADIAAPAEAAAVVKADAYGCGLDRVAPALAAAGAKTFFVAQALEGARLRRILGPGPVIYVFNGFMPSDLELFASNDMRPVVSSPSQLKALRSALYAFEAPPKIGVHIESGINRLGFTSEEIDLLRADGAGGCEITLVMSHLAMADEPSAGMNARQRGAFAGRSALLRAAAPGAQLSLAATGGTLLGAPFHFDLVRPGVGLYGGLPFGAAKRVVTLEAPLLQVRRVPAGDTVGYGAAWTARRDSRIGVLPLGYADGFFRTLKGVKTYLRGRPAPLVGRISMDMVTVDLTDHPDVQTGQLLEILGPNQSVDQLAACCGTIGYEVLTALGDRYQRRYIEAD